MFRNAQYLFAVLGLILSSLQPTEASWILKGCRSAIAQIRKANETPASDAHQEQQRKEWTEAYRVAWQNRNFGSGAIAVAELVRLNIDSLGLTDHQKKEILRAGKLLRRDLNLARSSESVAIFASDLAWMYGPFLLRPIWSSWRLPRNVQLPLHNEVASKLGLASDDFFKNSYEYLADLANRRARHKRTIFRDFIRSTAMGILLTALGYHPIDTVNESIKEHFISKTTSREYLAVSLLDLIRTAHQDEMNLARTPGNEGLVVLLDRNLLLPIDTVPIDSVRDAIRGIAEIAPLAKQFERLEQESFGSFEELNELLKKYKNRKRKVVMFHGLASITPNGAPSLLDFGEAVVNKERLSENIHQFEPGILENGSSLILAVCQAGDRGCTVKKPIEEPWIAWGLRLAGANHARVYAPVNLVSFSSVHPCIPPEVMWDFLQERNPAVGISTHPDISPLVRARSSHTREPFLKRVFRRGTRVMGSADLAPLRLDSLIPDEVRQLAVRVLDTREGVVRFIPLDGPARPDENVFDTTTSK